MPKVKIDTKLVKKAAVEAFKDSCFIAHRAIIEVITEVGAFSNFPDSDIIDKGILRGKQEPPVFSDGGATGTFRNSVDYGLYVYLGYTLRNGTEVEGRPWMAEGLKRSDFQKTFELLLKSKLS